MSRLFRVAPGHAMAGRVVVLDHVDPLSHQANVHLIDRFGARTGGGLLDSHLLVEENSPEWVVAARLFDQRMDAAVDRIVTEAQRYEVTAGPRRSSG